MLLPVFLRSFYMNKNDSCLNVSFVTKNDLHTVFCDSTLTDLSHKYKYDPVSHLLTTLTLLMSSEYGPYWVCDVCDDLIVLGQRTAHNGKCPGKLIRVIIPGVTGEKDGLPIEKPHEQKP